MSENERRYAINWRWVLRRVGSVTCWHQWGPGDGAIRLHSACQKCGVWRWYPIRDRRPWFKDIKPKVRATPRPTGGEMRQRYANTDAGIVERTMFQQHDREYCLRPKPCLCNEGRAALDRIKDLAEAQARVVEAARAHQRFCAGSRDQNKDYSGTALSLLEALSALDQLEEK